MITRQRRLKAPGIALLSASFLLASGLAFADTYQWVDKNGNFGFADSIEKVPPQYRSAAKKIAKTPASKDLPDLPARAIPPPVTPSSPSPEPEGTSEALAFEYQVRYQRAQTELAQLKASLARAQANYEELLRERNLRGRPLDPAEEDKAATALLDLYQRIQAKKYELETTIPDEARRAGIPLSELSR
jgi:hypothetical protein